MHSKFHFLWMWIGKQNISGKVGICILHMALRGNNTQEFSKNQKFFFWLKQCFDITKTRCRHRQLKVNNNFKDLNVCETLNAFLLERLFSIVAYWLLQKGCMNYKQFNGDFLVKNRTFSFKNAQFSQFFFLNSVRSSIGNPTEI